MAPRSECRLRFLEGKERTRPHPCGLRGEHCEGRHGGRGGGGREAGEEEEAAAAAPGQHGLAAFPRPSVRIDDRGGAGATAPDRAHDAATRTSCHRNRSMLAQSRDTSPCML